MYYHLANPHADEKGQQRLTVVAVTTKRIAPEDVRYTPVILRANKSLDWHLGEEVEVLYILVLTQTHHVRLFVRDDAETYREALQRSIELWSFLAETGKRKVDYTGLWKYVGYRHLCPLCEVLDKECARCPLGGKSDKPDTCGGEYNGHDSAYEQHNNYACAHNIAKAKEYAKAILDTLLGESERVKNESADYMPALKPVRR